MPPVALFAFLKSPLLRYLIAGAVLVSWAYFQGRSDCAGRHARKAAKDEAAWAEKLAGSQEAAYARGLQAARVEARNQAAVEGIAEDAQNEPGAGDVCLSADMVERLRQLEAN